MAKNRVHRAGPELITESSFYFEKQEDGYFKRVENIHERDIKTNSVKLKQETVSDNVHLPDSSEVYVSVGCEECHETGYLGRIGLFEFFSIDDMVKEAINSNASEEELTELSFSEENRLFESGLELVMQGLTSLDEVLRVTKEL